MSNGARILLVEDDESLGFLLKGILDAQGPRQYSYIPTAKKVSPAFHSHPFDLCILDIMLPQRDGFDLAREDTQIQSIGPYRIPYRPQPDRRPHTGLPGWRRRLCM